GRHAAGAHLDDAPDSVAVGAGGFDALLEIIAEHATLDAHAELAEQGLRNCSRRDERRRVPGARTLERVAHVRETELQRTRQIGVPWARQRHRLRALPGGAALRRPGAHPPGPVLVVAVADDERERRPERASVPQAGEHLDPVRLDALPWAAPVALLAAAQVCVDRVAVEHEARG